MTEHEIERLVVRLIGDAAGYEKMLADAEQRAKQTTGAIEQSMGRLESSSVAAGVMAANMVQNVSRKLESLGHSVVAAFSEQEDADVALTSALESNGRAVQATFKEYQEFSSEIQRTTRMADELVIGLLTSAESFNITGDAAKKATKDAIALAALPGAMSSAQGMIRLTAAMAQGDVQMAMMFARMVPQLRRIKDETKFLAEYQRLVAAGFKAEEAAARTYSGAMAQASNVTNDLGEDFGKVIATVLKPWIERWKAAVAVIKGFSPAVKELMVTVAGAVVGLVGFMLAFNNIATTIQVLGPLVSGLFLGTAGTIGLTTGAFVALAAAIALAAAAMYKLTPSVQAYNAAAKESAEISDKWIAKTKEETRALIDKARAMDLAAGRKAIEVGTETAQERVDNLTKAIARTHKELGRLVGDTDRIDRLEAGRPDTPEKAARQAKRQMGGEWDPTETNWFSRLFENKHAAALRQELEQYKKELAEAKTAVEELAKAQNELKGKGQGEVGASAEVVKEIAEMTRALDLQNQTFGMTTGAAAIFKFAMEGATDAQLDALKAVIGTNEHLAEQKKLVDELAGAEKKLKQEQSSWIDEVDNLTQGLQEQVKTFGMTSNAAQIRKMELRGYSDEELRAARAAAEMLDALEREHKLMEKGNRVTEQFAEPWEKVTKAQEELDEMLETGAISFDVYSKALADAEKDAYNLSDAADQLKDSMGLKAVLADSSEALEMWIKHQEMFYEPKKPGAEELPTTPPNFTKLLEQYAGMDVSELPNLGGMGDVPFHLPVGAGRDMPLAGDEPELPSERRRQDDLAGVTASTTTDRVVDLLQRLVDLAEQDANKDVVEITGADL